MEYFLRQIEPGVSSPFTIDLTSASYVFGRYRKCAAFEKLKKYPQVTKHHTCFVQKEDDWYVADMGSPDGTYLNYIRIDSFSLKKLEVGDHIGLGAKEVDDGFVCALCVRCPSKMDIKIEIKVEESSVQVDSNVVTVTESEKTDRFSGNGNYSNVVTVSESEKTERFSGNGIHSNVVSVSESEKTESFSGNGICSDGPVTKKIKRELLDVALDESYGGKSRDNYEIEDLSKRVQRDADSFEQILLSIPLDERVVTRSSRKRDDWTKKSIHLSASCFEVPFKTEKDGENLSLETREVLNRIDKIRKSLQSKGKITFTSNCSSASERRYKC